MKIIENLKKYSDDLKLLKNVDESSNAFNYSLFLTKPHTSDDLRAKFNLFGKVEPLRYYWKSKHFSIIEKINLMKKLGYDKFFYEYENAKKKGFLQSFSDEQISKLYKEIACFFADSDLDDGRLLRLLKTTYCNHVKNNDKSFDNIVTKEFLFFRNAKIVDMVKVANKNSEYFTNNTGITLENLNNSELVKLTKVFPNITVNQAEDILSDLMKNRKWTRSSISEYEINKNNNIKNKRISLEEVKMFSKHIRNVKRVYFSRHKQDLSMLNTNQR